MKKILAILMTLAILASLAVVAGAEGEKTVVIGGLYPLTGSAASSGRTMQYGINYAIERINAAGGINGYKLDVIWGDTQGDAAVSVTEAENLISEKNVDIVMGCYQSGVTLTACAVGESYECPFITANATSEALTAQGYEYFFRLAPTNMMFLRDMVQFCRDYSDAQGLDLKTIAILVDNTEVGQQTIEYCKYWAEQDGFEVIGIVTHASGAADLSSEVLQVKSLNADVLVVDQYVSDAILLTNTLVEQDYKPGLIIAKGNGYTESDYVAAMGNKLNGVCLATEFIEGARGMEISDGFKEFSGETMNGHSAEAFTVVYTIAEAVYNITSRGEEPTREALKDELDALVIEGKFFDGTELIMPYDTIDFCDATEVMGTEYLHTNMASTLTVAQYQDGQLWAVYPTTVAQKDVLYPAPFE